MNKLIKLIALTLVFCISTGNVAFAAGSIGESQFIDSSEISYQALNRWGNNLNPGKEDWTGVYPDDPQDKLAPKAYKVVVSHS